MNKNLKIETYFTRGKQAKKLVRWKKVDAMIKDAQGQIYFSMQGIRAPESWSQLAIEVAASKYFRKFAQGKKSENSIEQLVERVCAFLQTQMHKQKGYFRSSKEKENFLEELKYILYTQRGAFNSPVWFNAGLWESYGLAAYRQPQVSACFIQSVEDSIEGIFNLARSEARLFKHGSGTGTNFSTLRSKYEELESGGTSSGLISFLDVLDRGAGAIKSGGTTRRAAKMVIADIDHPEIEDFIVWKMNEEKKAHALIRAGWSSGFEGQAYKTVSGQNANLSVRVTDQFMKAVLEDRDWILRRRRDGKKFKTLKARKLWRQIAEAAWNCADPGLQFHDTINKWHTCSQDGSIINASNPCSEFMFVDDSACNLASLNLVKFLDEQGDFDLQGYMHTVRILYIAQDLFVSGAGYPTEKIRLNSHNYRPLGLGYANLGSLIMRLGYSYDSAEGREWAAILTSLLSAQAYFTSVELAKAVSPFPAWKKNKTSHLRVLKAHKKAHDDLKPSVVPLSIYEAASGCWQQVLKLQSKYGIRNSQATLIAPTGTIGLMMDCDTTGVEPDFSLVKRKKLAGGGELMMTNQAVSVALTKLGYTEVEIEKMLKEIESVGDLSESQWLRKEHQKIFLCATGRAALSADAHLLMMQAVQPFLSGAISKTVNLPKDTTVEEIEKTYMKAWRLGLKSIALYRDGSKGAQPLTAVHSSEHTETGILEKSKLPQETNENSVFAQMKCPECGGKTELHSGCYRCVNCGFSLGCA